jgi:hypothetical protein
VRAVILVPYRDDDPVRAGAWHYTRRFWRTLGIPICTADSPEDAPFDITSARNAAVSLADDMTPGWEVALMADADVYLDSTQQAEKALEWAYVTDLYIAAHDELRYLAADHCSIEHTVMGTWETVFAFSRTLWLEVGGFDPRFRGFGHQVEAFFHAARTLRGARRVHGPCFHLWHPYSADKPNPHLDENRALAERYWEASGDKEKMTALLAEYVVAT